MTDLFSSDEGQTYTGTIERVIFENPQGTYTVARFRPERGGAAFVVVGNLGGAQEGERLRLQGKWVHHQRFGEQFQVLTCQQLALVAPEDVAHYLAAHLPGIGEKTAEQIVEHFGDETLEVVFQAPERLGEVRGIGQKRIQAIREVVERRRGQEATQLFLHSVGIRGSLLKAVLERYGPEAEKRVRENPYCLIEFSGVGFRRADSVAQKLGVAPDSPQRAAAALDYVLEKALEQGSTCLSPQELLEQGEKECQVPLARLEEALQEKLEQGSLLEAFGDVYLPYVYHTERRCARQVRQLLSWQGDGGEWELERLEYKRYSEEQRRAICEALSSKVFVLTGGPGVGKTYTLCGLAQLLSAHGREVALAAPTGRAAKRLEEATGYEAKTLHRLLKYQPGKGFFHNRRNPLEVDTVIVDESSMLDLFLFGHLLDALPLSAQLILVGDRDQLPPVGPGQPFWDLLDCPAVPSRHLSQIFRQKQGSQIIQNAHRVRAGEMPQLRNDATGDFFFLAERDQERILQMLEELIQVRLPRRYGFPPHQIQVLTPMRRGKLGYENLNQRLQQAFNPTGAVVGKAGPYELREGDKVIQTQNNYDKEVFNGDIGWVRRRQKDTVEVDFDGRTVPYRLSELGELALAYAISVHKSQGSEYPCVIVPILSEHYVLLRRNLLYTAMTRGKNLVLIIGDARAVALAVRRPPEENRKSHFGDFLAQFLGGAP